MSFVGEMLLTDGTAVLVEVSGAEPDGVGRVGRATTMARTAAETLQEAMTRVRPALDAVAGSVRGMAHAPDTVRVDFGIKLTAEAGVVVATAATEANFAVSVEWQNSARTPPTTGDAQG
jgi:hypothetical protein